MCWVRLRTRLLFENELSFVSIETTIGGVSSRKLAVRLGCVRLLVTGVKTYSTATLKLGSYS